MYELIALAIQIFVLWLGGMEMLDGTCYQIADTDYLRCPIYYDTNLYIDEAADWGYIDWYDSDEDTVMIYHDDSQCIEVFGRYVHSENVDIEGMEYWLFCPQIPQIDD